ncbi:MAG: zinc ABC transporter substrate-binding protein [Caldilineaceae bacterium]|nr:zinc ABC transporter substrate-binding protein [Caldilineaceae bacterium]
MELKRYLTSYSPAKPAGAEGRIKRKKSYGYLRNLAAMGLVTLLGLVACATPPALSPAPTESPANTITNATDDTAEDAAVQVDSPAPEAADLAQGESLRVAATTNIITDVTARIGGDAAVVTGLLPIGADPHSYEATPQDLRALSDAHVIFINGLELEASLEPVLETVDTPVVTVNQAVETLSFAGDHNEDADGEHAHGDADPHTWFSIDAVIAWTHTIEETLQSLDPAHAQAYAANAEGYRAELAALKAELTAQVDQIPPAERKLVTDHEALGYFAHEYDFEIIGTVIPSLSTLAAPSAAELAALQDQIRENGVKAILVSTTVNPTLAEQVATDAGAAVVPVYTGSLSGPDGPASTYLDFMRYDVSSIVAALK